MGIDLRFSNSVVGKIVAQGQVSSANTDTTIHSVPESKALEVTTASITNVTGSAVTVSISVVKPGGTVSAATRLISSYSLAANDTTRISELENAILDEGAFISVNVSAGSALNYLITGKVYQ